MKQPLAWLLAPRATSSKIKTNKYMKVISQENVALPADVRSAE
jgi:hypothetical protein